MAFPTSPTNGTAHTDNNSKTWQSTTNIWAPNPLGGTGAAADYYSTLGLTATSALPTTKTKDFIINDLVSPVAAYLWNQTNSAYEVYDTTTAASITLPTADQVTSYGGWGPEFNADGTQITIKDLAASATVYNLSTAYDISTQDAGTVIAAPFAGDIRSFTFTENGTTALAQSGTTIQKYTLTTPYDISASTLHSSWATGMSGAAADVFTFNNDGTKIYGISTDGDFRQATLGTAYDLSTAVLDFSAAFGLARTGILFSDDGLTMWVSNVNGVLAYTLGTAWDAATRGAGVAVTTLWDVTQGVYGLARIQGPSSVAYYTSSIVTIKTTQKIV